MSEHTFVFPYSDLSLIAKKESWRKEVNRPLYHIHKWWATRLGSVFRAIAIESLSSSGLRNIEEFYAKYSFSDKVVLDPFMGSGTTLGEAAKLGAKCIGSDINPVSYYLVNQAFKQVNLDLTKKAFDTIEKNIAETIKSYYRTKDETGTEYPALYYLWVKEIQTDLGEKIPLFSNYIVSKDAYPSKKPTAYAYCPNCGAIIKCKFNDTSIECPECNHKYNPQKGTCNTSRVVDSKGISYKIKDLVQKYGFTERLYCVVGVKDGIKQYKKPTDFDYKLLEKAKEDYERLKDSLILPHMEIKSGYNTDQVLDYGYHYWADFFNTRQKLCLGLLLNEILAIDESNIRDQLVCLFSGMLEYNNMFCSYKGEGTGAVRTIFSNHILKPEKRSVENSIWGYEQSSGCFSSLFNSRLIRAKKYLEEPFEIMLDGSKKVCSNPITVNICTNWNQFSEDKNGMLILNQNSMQLDIPSESVDYVITDPPYFDFINYSELSDFFYSWLFEIYKKDGLFDRELSRSAGDVQNSNPEQFALSLGAVFKECCRVLKDEGELTFTFHHSDYEGWAAILMAIINSGMKVVRTIPVYGELSRTSIKSGTDEPITLDVLITCVKKTNTNQYQQPSALEYYTTFKKLGFELSKTDFFVICASESLLLKNSYETFAELIHYVQTYCTSLHNKVNSN